MKDIAFVGTPCQITAIRRGQLYLKNIERLYDETLPHEGRFPQTDALKKFESIKLTIGLFCFENFYYPHLAKVLKEKGIDLEDVHKMRVEGGRMELLLNDGKKKEVPLDDKEVKNAVLASCSICEDFTSEMADISVGSVGSPDGYSTVILRSDNGMTFFQNAVKNGYIEIQEDIDINAVDKISQKKKRMAKKNLKARENLLPTPSYSDNTFDARDALITGVLQNFFSLEGIIKNGLCTICGACEAVCPAGAIEMEGNSPVFRGKCKIDTCGLCFSLCPMNFTSLGVEKGRLFEGFMPVGEVKKTYIARATDHEITKFAQDGGVVSALLKYGIKNNIISGAVGVCKSEEVPWDPTPTYIGSIEDIAGCAGSKYSACPTLLSFK